MSSATPPLDPRTEAQLSAELTDQLRASLPDWRATGDDQTSAALIAIAARFAGLVIQRLNQAPDKNFLAFLDLLGTARMPPIPARVPLTFTVTPGGTTDAIVPAGTPVAAAPAPGDTVPVTFETERELAVVAASLQTLVAVDAERDLVGDHSALLTSPATRGVQVFSGNRANEHVLYIGHAGALSFAQIAALTLSFQSHHDSPVAHDLRKLQWELWDGVNGIPLKATDTTQQLRRGGHIGFADLTQVPEQAVYGIRSRWLRCRLLTPVSPGATPAKGMVRAAQLPLLKSIRVSATLSRTAMVPEFAFANAQAVDVSRAFLPFGDRPGIGDVFYLGQREALGRPGGTVAVQVTLVNPVSQGPSVDLTLRWEAWNGVAWVLLGETTPTGSRPGTPLVDASKAFTQSNAITFTLPTTLAEATVNGVTSHWVRVQIVAGNYGADAGYVVDASKPGGFQLVLATLAPPLVKTLTLSYNAVTLPTAPDAVLALNNAQFQDLMPALLAGRAAPFMGFETQPPALYAALALPSGRKTFPSGTLSLYHGVRLPPYGEQPAPLAPGLSVRSGAAGHTVVHRFMLTNTDQTLLVCTLWTCGGAWVSAIAPAAATLPPGLSTEIQVSVTVPASGTLPGPDAGDRGFLNVRLSSQDALHSVAFETRVGSAAPRRRELRFEYWNGSGWMKLIAEDGTDRLSRPGIVEFLGPGDFPASEQFGVSGHWIRALYDAGDDQPVQLRSLWLNTVFATQAVTLRNEVMGSSDASAHQQLRTARGPVLAEPQLEVRESDTWVRWIEVADFHGSAAQDRHYVLDHISGQVSFGNGVRGRIPPRGTGNIRMARYQTGGGSAGNRAAGSIVQLKTTVPYIDKVANLEAATGGVDAESDSALVARGPRTLRHGGRAVALDDYEDLARSASPEVARARSVPLRWLQDDPLSQAEVLGAVSVVIVPQSAEAKPLPTTGLIKRVSDHLRRYSTPTAALAVVGPLYVRVEVSIEIALVSPEGASRLEVSVREALSAFLHPLTGGREGTGWDFGRQPQLSDLHALVSDVPGVDHIRQLTLDQVEEPPGAMATLRFLVYSGRHRITFGTLGTE